MPLESMLAQMVKSSLILFQAVHIPALLYFGMKWVDAFGYSGLPKWMSVD